MIIDKIKYLSWNNWEVIKLSKELEVKKAMIKIETLKNTYEDNNIVTHENIIYNNDSIIYEEANIYSPEVYSDTLNPIIKIEKSGYNINNPYTNTKNTDLNKISKVLTEIKEYKDSIEIIWEKTLKEVIKLYKIKSLDDIKKLQKKLWFREQDGIIWGVTLEKIFNDIEKKNLNNYPNLKERVDLKKEMISLLESKRKNNSKIGKLKLTPYNHKNYYGYSEFKERLPNNDNINKKAFSLLKNNLKVSNDLKRKAPKNIEIKKLNNSTNKIEKNYLLQKILLLQKKFDDYLWQVFMIKAY